LVAGNIEREEKSGTGNFKVKKTNAYYMSLNFEIVQRFSL